MPILLTVEASQGLRIVGLGSKLAPMTQVNFIRDLSLEGTKHRFGQYSFFIAHALRCKDLVVLIEFRSR